MKNAQGVIRSAEFLKANPEQAPKVHHLRIHPHTDGVRVTHHASAEAKPHAEHMFGHEDESGLMAHISQHTGYGEAPEHGEAEEEGEEV